MERMIRKQLYLNAEQNFILKQRAKEMGITEAELVRRAITSHISTAKWQKKDVRAWEEEKKFIQQLIKQGPAKGQRTWKREELYER
ncbi:CopG family transcriptional regulator [Moorella sp. E308F]|uniref:ribbon-helix-helix domain-containing protein n=1 Tax=Moorella sp. E308F TaxID=2572682 RepID=UPI0010FFC294|nr:CopG family transcriptional regulator [Moorella sp. E308F]GEA13955.1 CopG family transcriptional regulator [Moorella sp. E308F]